MSEAHRRQPGPIGQRPGTTAAIDPFLAELGSRLLADGLRPAGGALTLAVPHPIIARRTRSWRAGTGGGAVREAWRAGGSGDRGAGLRRRSASQAGRDWLAGLGPVHEDTVGPRLDSPGPDSPMLGWAAS